MPSNLDGIYLGMFFCSSEIKPHNGYLINTLIFIDWLVSQVTQLQSQYLIPAPMIIRVKDASDMRKWIN